MRSTVTYSGSRSCEALAPGPEDPDAGLAQGGLLPVVLREPGGAGGGPSPRPCAGRSRTRCPAGRPGRRSSPPARPRWRRAPSLPSSVSVTMSGSAPALTRLTSFRVAVSKSATVPRSVLSAACSATAMVRPCTATELAPGVASVPTFSGAARVGDVEHVDGPGLGVHGEGTVALGVVRHDLGAPLVEGARVVGPERRELHLRRAKDGRRPGATATAAATRAETARAARAERRSRVTAGSSRRHVEPWQRSGDDLGERLSASPAPVRRT